MLFLAALIVGTGIVASGVGNTAAADPSADDWLRLRECESGNNYTINTGNGYFGAYQFDLDTWHSVGGTGYPNQASPATQDALALRLWQAQGWTPWTCAEIIGLTTPQPPRPLGTIDVVSASGSYAFVAGWDFDPNASGVPTATHIYVNGVGYPFVADKARPDVNAAFGIDGAHGFAETVPLREGANEVCVWAIGVAYANNTMLGCRTVQGAKPIPPYGSFDQAIASGASASVAGWAFDPSAPSQSIPVHVYVNGTGFAFTANKPRDDVNQAFGVTGQHGFVETISLRPGPNSVCVFGIGIAPNINTLFLCKTVMGPPLPPSGTLDLLAVSGLSAHLAGWAFDPNSSDVSIPVHIYVNDVGTAYTANLARPDVDSVFGITGQHGFDQTVALRAGSNSICLYAIGVTFDNNTQFACRDVQANAAQAGVQRLASSQGPGGATATVTPIPIPIPTPTPTPTSTPAVAPPTTLSAPPSMSHTPTAVTAPTASSVPGTASTAPAASTGVSGAVSTNPIAATPFGTVAATPTSAASARGALDGMTTTNQGWTARGWAFDPGRPAAPIRVGLSVNGVVWDIAADLPRSDVNGAQGLTGAHGFEMPVTLALGHNEVCLFQLEPDRTMTTAPIACTSAEVTG